MGSQLQVPFPPVQADNVVQLTVSAVPPAIFAHWILVVKWNLVLALLLHWLSARMLHVEEVRVIPAKAVLLGTAVQSMDGVAEMQIIAAVDARVGLEAVLERNYLGVWRAGVVWYCLALLV